MTGIVVQARIGSRRLPGKVLLPVGGRPVLGRLLDRVAALPFPLVVATTTAPADDLVVDWCRAAGVDCFRGSEPDVLDRYYRCALAHGFRQVVRLTADNIFPDLDELERLIRLQKETGADYCESGTALPVGVGAEIFTFAALARCRAEGRQPQHREHVNEYILEHPELFRIATLAVSAQKRRPEVRLTIDTRRDYERACYVVERAGERALTTALAIELALAFEGGP